ncbi:MAG TPA: hypothetical protein VNA24_37260 [Hyalangium sp.]|jgi:hypothetical protein|nr:hypothetical protein [Hyalangium sp.]
MNSTLLKTFRNVVLGAFLVAGCGGGEPIPVDLKTAAGVCEYGQEFMTEGMRMVMRDGQLMVVPEEEGEVQAAWEGYRPPKGPTTNAGCEGCH